MVTKRERATPMAPEDRRKAIIDVVVPLIAQHGPTVTTKQIAEAAGIAEGTIFRVFPDKRALFLAVAADTVSPAGGSERMAAALAGVPDLREKLVITVTAMVERLHLGMMVMMALRHLFLTEGPPKDLAKEPPGPPAFLRESNRQLLDSLTEHVFTPHASELTMAPDRAALVLRSMVFGTWHPGFHDDARLTPEEIADACLHGVRKGD